MKKIDLARQYCLTGIAFKTSCFHNVYNKPTLFRDVKGLKEALIRHGYHSKDRSITPKQVQIFYDFLGEP